jgi:hypothetical protein
MFEAPRRLLLPGEGVEVDLVRPVALRLIRGEPHLPGTIHPPLGRAPLLEVLRAGTLRDPGGLIELVLEQ